MRGIKYESENFGLAMGQKKLALLNGKLSHLQAISLFFKAIKDKKKKKKHSMSTRKGTDKNNSRIAIYFRL